LWRREEGGGSRIAVGSGKWEVGEQGVGEQGLG